MLLLTAVEDNVCSPLEGELQGRRGESSVDDQLPTHSVNLPS